MPGTNFQTSSPSNMNGARPNKEDAGDEKGKMFVGGLSWETTQENLHSYFGRFGEISDCVVMKNPETGRSRGFGFITFTDPSNMDAVLENCPHQIDGRTVDPKPCNPRASSSRAKRTNNAPKVFLGGLPPNITETDLRNFFSQYGKVTEVVIMYDQQQKKSRGFGFLSFESDDSVDRCAAEHFVNINGKQVEIKKAEPRDNRFPSQRQQWDQSNQQPPYQGGPMGGGPPGMMQGNYPPGPGPNQQGYNQGYGQQGYGWNGPPQQGGWGGPPGWNGPPQYGYPGPGPNQQGGYPNWNWGPGPYPPGPPGPGPMPPQGGPGGPGGPPAPPQSGSNPPPAKQEGGHNPPPPPGPNYHPSGYGNQPHKDGGMNHYGPRGYGPEHYGSGPGYGTVPPGSEPPSSGMHGSPIGPQRAHPQPSQTQGYHPYRR